MKKLILLFTMACAAGQLYGMLEAQNIMDLPQDVRNEIIKMTLPSSDNLDETIKAIKASVLRAVRYDNLKTFTALMNVLENKFPSTTRQEIAEKIDTEIAKKYIDVNSRLLQAIKNGKLEIVKELVDLEDADPNFTSYKKNIWGFSLPESNLQEAKVQAIYETTNAKEILKFLLEKGMSPLEKGGTIAQYTRPIPDDVAELLKQYSRANK